MSTQALSFLPETLSGWVKHGQLTSGYLVKVTDTCADLFFYKVIIQYNLIYVPLRFCEAEEEKYEYDYFNVYLHFQRWEN